MEKLSPKESVKGADTVLRGSVKAPKGFSESQPKAAKPRGRSAQGFTAESLPEENPEGALTHCPAAHCRRPRYSSEGTVFQIWPKDFLQLLRLTFS